MHINEMYFTYKSFNLLARNGITTANMLRCVPDEFIIALKGGNKEQTDEILEALHLLRKVGEKRFLEEWMIQNHYLNKEEFKND